MNKGDLDNDDDGIDDYGREAENLLVQVFEDDYDDSDVCEYDQDHNDNDESSDRKKTVVKRLRLVYI